MYQRRIEKQRKEKSENRPIKVGIVIYPVFPPFIHVLAIYQVQYTKHDTGNRHNGKEQEHIAGREEGGVERGETGQQHQAPQEAVAKVEPPPPCIVALQIEGETEQEGENGIGLARKKRKHHTEHPAIESIEPSGATLGIYGKDEMLEIMNHDYGNSLCISSQVGCNMGCKFCESGRRKKVRNLRVGEMVEQLLLVEQESNLKISHVVIMGIGEPFDNYDNICNFIKIINHPKGLNIGARHITVSTCGLVPKILEFSDFPYQVNLAISLHAPTDELRKTIMPIAKVYSLKDLMASLDIYYKKTKRRITFEYILLDNVNDKEKDALALAKLLKGKNAYVNLIPYNETSTLQFKRSNPLKIARFYDILKKNNITVTIRREFGGTISAACGQLRSKKEEA